MVDDLRLELKTLSVDKELSAEYASKVEQLENEVVMWREKCEDLESSNKNEVDSLLVDLKEQVSQIGKMRAVEEYICESCEKYSSSNFGKQMEEENKILLQGIEEIRENNAILLEKLKEVKAEAEEDRRKEFEIASLKMKIIDLKDQLAHSLLAEQELAKRMDNMDSVFSKTVQNIAEQCETLKQSNEDFKNIVKILKTEEEENGESSEDENLEIQELHEKLKEKDESFDLLVEENKELQNKLLNLSAENAAIKETQKKSEELMEEMVRKCEDLKEKNRNYNAKLHRLKQCGIMVDRF